jgi:DNA-binding HxlR family transcriptional regulator
MRNEVEEEACSLARAAAIIGDRWILLILRESFLGVTRFSDFQANLGIARGMLTDRLRKLTDLFIFTRIPYQQLPRRYEYQLTPKGRSLYAVMRSLVYWGDTFLITKKGRPVVYVHERCGSPFDPVLVCSECGELVNERNVRMYFGPACTDNRYPPLPPTISLEGTVADPRPKRREKHKATKAG